MHRSVIAAECLKNILEKNKKDHVNIVVDSYGLQGTQGTTPPIHKKLSQYPKEWAAAQPTLRKLHIDIQTHTSQPITARIMKKASVVIAMDEKVSVRATNSLKKQFPNQIHKIHRFAELTPDHKTIKDPAGNGNKKFHEKIIRRIHSTLQKKYKNIIVWAKINE